MYYLLYILFFIAINLPAKDLDVNAIIIKCSETTGTGRSDIFMIDRPSFKWNYKGKWYELAISNNGVAKDWDVNFFENKVNLFNKKTEWKRSIDLRKMIASMEFSTGEKYLYKCKKISS